jgi:hypothetical protein
MQFINTCSAIADFRECPIDPGLHVILLASTTLDGEERPMTSESVTFTRQNLGYGVNVNIV